MKLQNVTSGPTYLMLAPEKKTPPTVIFSHKALKWIECMIDAHSDEIGFYGVVDELQDYTFYVRDIFYPKHQLITSATCEISPEGEAAVMEWLINHHREEDINKMILWGHSHHTMGVSPSGQDDTQALTRMQANKANVLRVIVNKSGLMSVSFFDYQQQIRFDNVAWKPEEKINAEAEFDAKVKMVGDILNSNIASSLKLSEIINAIQTDTERDEIIKKIEILKKENAPIKTVVHNSKDYEYPNYQYQRDDHFRSTYPHYKGYHYERGYQPPKTAIFPKETKVVQTNLLRHDDEIELNEGFSEHTSLEVQELLKAYGEII